MVTQVITPTYQSHSRTASAHTLIQVRLICIHHPPSPPNPHLFTLSLPLSMVPTLGYTPLLLNKQQLTSLTTLALVGLNDGRVVGPFLHVDSFCNNCDTLCVLNYNFKL